MAIQYIVLNVYGILFCKRKRCGLLSLQMKQGFKKGIGGFRLWAVYELVTDTCCLTSGESKKHDLSRVLGRIVLLAVGVVMKTRVDSLSTSGLIY